MKTRQHGFKDLNEIKKFNQLNFKNVIGSVRLINRRIKLKTESEFMVSEFLKFKFKPQH